MKNHKLHIVYFLTALICIGFVACKTDSQSTVETEKLATEKQSKPANKKATIHLQFGDEKFTYSKKLYKESDIEYGQGLELDIEEEGLPEIRFNFPDADESLAAGFSSFRYEDRMSRAAAGFHSPVTLNFRHRDNETGKRMAISFLKGDMNVTIKNNRAMIDFKGIGRQQVIAKNAEKVSIPVKGTIHISLPNKQK